MSSCAPANAFGAPADPEDKLAPRSLKEAVIHWRALRMMLPPLLGIARDSLYRRKPASSEVARHE